MSIDKIDGGRPIRGTPVVRKVGKGGKASGTSFSQHIEAEDTPTSSVVSTAVSALAGIDALLGAQEVDDAAYRESKGKARAEELLDNLDDLRMDLLSGNVSREKLKSIANLVSKNRPEVDDPRLSQILDEIDLRAQVELAKLT